MTSDTFNAPATARSGDHAAAAGDARRPLTGPWRFVPGFGRPTARFVHRWAIALLVSNVGIVATGGAVRVTAKLGFLLSAMKGMVEGEIQRVLKEKLG